MRNFSNTYIFIFSAVMVIIVAVLLSFVAMQLKPLQDMNKEIERMGDILGSVGKAEDASEVKDKKAYINEEFDKYITSTYVIDFDGNIVERDAFEVTLNIKVQTDKPVEERVFPIFVFTGSEGETKYIVPLRGKGLWGPIWGYVAFNPDMNSIYGAVYDHAKETPGLGSEINADFFEHAFRGRKIFNEAGEFVSVEVVKGGTSDDNLYGVDAISGGTITSKALEDMLMDNFQGYVKHFKEKAETN